MCEDNQMAPNSKPMSENMTLDNGKTQWENVQVMASFNASEENKSIHSMM
jgi:hypothetical protein